ncbi:MAG: hypothetical protein ABSD77_01970 [Verrucomicrobiota bacterium]|jgi:glycosyltransferase involved in cell wall biosynthesis
MGSFPKILFVHDYRPEARIVADLIRQMFLGYPVDKINWWHCRQTPLYEQPDLRAASVHGFRMPEKLVPHVRLTGAKSFLLENLWAPLAARHLERTIATVKPDLVAALLFGWSVPVLRRARLPAGQRLHVSLWDFPDTNGMRKVLGESRSRRFVEDIFSLVRRADSFDGISPAMLEEIQARTGRADGLLIHSGFEPHHLQALENSPDTRAPGDVIRLAFVGTIISESDFRKVIAALEKVRLSLSQKVVLEFFGGRNYRHRPWFNPDWMIEHPLFTDQELIGSLRHCDWGIVVMDPEGGDLRYSRFSFSNKIGTCLCAGVPVLGFGHPQTSLGQIMREQHLGKFTSGSEPASLEKFLLESLQTPEPRRIFRDDILRSARTEFNAAEMRARLWRLWGVR